MECVVGGTAMRNGRSMGLGEQLPFLPPAFSKILTHVGSVGRAANKPPLPSALRRWAETLMPSGSKATDLVFVRQQLCSASLGGPWAVAWENHLLPQQSKESAEVSIHRDHHQHRSPVVPPAMLFPCLQGGPHKRCGEFLMCVAAAQRFWEDTCGRLEVWEAKGTGPPYRQGCVEARGELPVHASASHLCS